MKKLLPLLSSIFLVSAPTGILVQNLDLVFRNLEFLPPDSMLNLVKTIDSIASTENDIDKWASNYQEIVQTNYTSLLQKSRNGDTIALNVTAIDEKIIETFTDTYTNNTPKQQIYQPKLYLKNMKNVSNLSLTLSESVAVEFNKAFFFFGFKITGSFSSGKTSIHTRDISEFVKSPTQEFVVDAYSIGKVTYLLKEGLYNGQGLIRFMLPLDAELVSSKWITSDGLVKDMHISVFNLVQKLNDNGYGDWLAMDAKKYSVISADNPKNPSIISINLPIKWQNQSGKFEVENSQTPINN